jgi:hypothetical protein
MKRLRLLLVLLPVLYAQTAAQTTEVEITAEPSHHFALENEYVRVFNVEVATQSRPSCMVIATTMFM